MSDPSSSVVGMSIKQRAYPTAAQAAVMRIHCGQARFVWNLAVEQAAMWRRHKGPTPNNAVRMRQLTEARGAFEWLREGSTVVQQGALRDFDQAQRNWWAGTHRRPTFRRKGVSEGFVVRDLTLKRASRRTGMALVPKVGWVRFRLSRPWENIEAASSARVTLKHGQWHVSFTTPPPDFKRAPTGAVVGVDRGASAHNTLALSDGRMLAAPTLSVRERAKFLALERRLARQIKGSNRRQATKDSMGVLRLRLNSRRTDWVEKATTMLVREHDVIAIEALNTKGMTRAPASKPDPDAPGVFLPNGSAAKAALSRMILASQWGKIEQRLHHKAARATSPVTIVSVPAHHTSQRCFACGHTAPENRDSQAVFECVACGYAANADTNAAENILARALELVPA